MLNQFKFSIVVFILSVCLPQLLLADGEYVDLCRLFKNGTLVRQPGSCENYIKCVDGEGTIHSCESPNVFDASTQKCAKATASNSIYCGNPCEGLDSQWVSDSTDCHHWFYCLNGQAVSGRCDIGQHFEQKTQTCVWGTDSDCVDVANICQILPDKTTFIYEADCSKYYQCSKGSHTVQTCKNTYYDVQSGKCIEKKLVECNAHPKTDICIVSKKPYVGFQPDGATCRGYFYCRNLGIVEDIDPAWYQCPEGYFFHDGLKACAVPSSVVCKHDRCESRGTMLVTSSNNDCHNYIECVDGVEVQELACEWDWFFDESIQACTKTIIYDGCCDGQK